MRLLFLILLLMNFAGCQSSSTSPTYGEVFFSDSEWISDFNKQHSLLKLSNSLDSNWVFMGRDSVQGIQQDVPIWKNKGESVCLPHRLSFPNQSYWYQWQGELEKGILYVDADDGAQVWRNGSRISKSEPGDYFVIPESGRAQLTIRVINNAMAGGLRKVHFVDQAAFEKWRDIREEAWKILLSERKAALIQDRELKSQLKEMDAQTRDEILAVYPILFTEPVQILGENGQVFLRWVSEQDGKAWIQFDNGKRVEVSSENNVFTWNLDSEYSGSFQLYQEKAYLGEFQILERKRKEKVSLAIWGDPQGGWDTFRKIASKIGEHQPDLSIGLGDLVNNGSEYWVYPRFLQTVVAMNSPQLFVPGNHDYDGYYEDMRASAFEKYLLSENQTTYGFHRIGQVGIITLDPNTFFPVGLPDDSAQKLWLDSILNSRHWIESSWKIIAVHQPPFSQGWPGYHGEESLRKLLEPYFHSGLIDIVLSGHTHDYERLTGVYSGHPVHFLIFGGAGGSLEPIGEKSSYPEMDRLIKTHHFGIADFDSTKVNLRVYDTSGQLIDQISFQNPKQ
ncbi:metallophosphoesterase family protein [Algoriphagus hitonicola]|uniref:Calcineurin-like phosphoesterase n=1 Tax=Algoriphagus hitonicola TaxID=435880 RepID=A0A1I2XII7_9BACT|nr:metallophosphoesterase [Algoriphagus hitonicola]SFH13225.1 Calcineurin-like phosphoesterase [Algoriphagus hitonicola]